MHTEPAMPSEPHEVAEPLDRRKQILEAAVRVFSEKGFHKATNKDIAQAAGGISPGLIYHYFKDKEDLLFSLLHERISVIRLADRADALMALPPREGLNVIGQAYLGMLASTTNVALFRVILGEAFRFPELAETFYRSIIQRFFAVLVRYFEYQVELGRLRAHDPSIAVRSFVGMFIAHVLMRELFRQPEALAVSNEAVLAQVVDTFLNGLGAAEQPAQMVSVTAPQQRTEV